MIPTLTTARLKLRPFRPEDLDAHAAIWSDPRVSAHIGRRVRTREESWLRMLSIEGHWHWFGFGFWAVEMDGTLIGNAGFQRFERGIDPPLDAPEAGWALTADKWGMGLATEAVEAMMAWADARGWPKVVAIIDPGNAASVRVAEKAGFAFQREATHRDQPVNVYGRLAGARGAA